MLLGLLLLVLAVAGCALFALKPVWFPLAITADAVQWDREFVRTLWIAGVIFVGVQLLLAFAILRAKRARRTTGTHGNWWVQVVCTALTGGLFLTMAVLASQSWAKVASAGSAPEIIEVHAHQFAWNFRYAGPDGKFGKTNIDFINDAGGNPVGIDPQDPAGKDDFVASTLRIPVGRDVLLLMHSRDVIHDFFVRELRTKQDIVPGMEITLEMKVTEPGKYEIACAELCGLGHSQMRSYLIAMPAREYDQWKLQR